MEEWEIDPTVVGDVVELLVDVIMGASLDVVLELVDSDVGFGDEELSEELLVGELDSDVADETDELLV